jgi:hypothetical protein
MQERGQLSPVNVHCEGSGQHDSTLIPATSAQWPRCCCLPSTAKHLQEGRVHAPERGNGVIDAMLRSLQHVHRVGAQVHEVAVLHLRPAEHDARWVKLRGNTSFGSLLSSALPQKPKMLPWVSCIGMSSTEDAVARLGS